MKKLILKRALINALEHGGKANVQAVVGKVLAEKPSLKTEIKKVVEEVRRIVEEINKLSIEEQKKKLRKFRVRKKVKRREEYKLPELPNAIKGKVITAFPPEPSKYPHLGHAKAALLNFMYAKKYKGKFILRFEDSNPLKIRKEYYEAFIDGLKWLGIKWNKIDYLSDHLPRYYKTIEKLIEMNNAYVCLCKKKIIREKRARGEICKHRENSIEENLRLWKLMLDSKVKGVVRLKIDMKHPNTTMRDPAIARIVLFPHPRTKKKFKVWPTYDFGTSMLDVWEGITHRIRSKEFEIRKELQQYIQRILGYKPPYIREIGRFEMEGVPTQGRIIRAMIARKQLKGWDDPRLTTLIALKRRGFLPEAIRNFLISTGVTKAEAVFEWEMLSAFNRKIADSKANRFFCVLDPIKISIENAPDIKSITINMHPDFPRRGKRKIRVSCKKIYIEREDLKKFRNKRIGLINLMTIKLGQKSKFISMRIDPKDQKIHWISEPNIRIKIVMPDGKVKKALAEFGVRNLKEDEIIQFYRIGFCRVDKKEGEKIVLYFAHK
jgi:glutamyl-tRNA synthetase